MPPFSRGWSIVGSVRYASSKLKIPQKKKVPKFKTSPIESRQKPEPTRQTRPSPNNASIEANLPSFRSQRPSQFGRLVNVIPPSYRRTIGTTLIAAPFVGLVWLHFPVSIMYINGGSMAPFFNPNASPDLPETKDKILVQSLMYRSRKDAGDETGLVPSTGLRRGQIVVFSTPHDPSRIAVKRIVGIPGDRVQPLPGYGAGDEPVVVQYNHLWVEGDVEDRNKSVDSNWYGPICQNLVLGKVISLLEPWYRPTTIKIEEHKYPAREKRRVEEHVVGDAMLAPDEVKKIEAFVEGTNIASQLEVVAEEMDEVVSLLRGSEQQRRDAYRYYRDAKKEIRRGDPRTVETAKKMASLFEDAMVKAGFDRDNLREEAERTVDDFERKQLQKELQGEDPFMQVGTMPVHEIPEAAKKEVEEGPAARALREHLEKQRKERLEGTPNGLDGSDRQLMWKEQDRIMRENAERIQAESARKRAEAAIV